MTAEVESWLADGAGSGEPAARVIETSIAKVFLFAERALKVKKAVDFGFLDFTTLERRRWAVERELAFNRPAAPDIYRAVHAVTREPGGALALDGQGEAVEWVLEMRRFPDGAVLAERADAVDGALGETLGRAVADFHARAPRADRDAAACVRYVLKSNAQLLRQEKARLGETAVEALIAASEAAFAPLEAGLADRAGQGFVRRCHGDLHLGNILLQDGRPVLFDCIEFNDVLSEIDVLYDLAFLLMDLDFRGRAEAANRALNGWLDQAARAFPGPELWTGLRALPLFLSMRAAIRAHVSVHQHGEAQARLYLQRALAHLDPNEPRLTAIGGLSGSGKSHQARALAPGVGAVVLRTDEIRKRLWGRAPLDPLPPEAYARSESERVYGEMMRTAGQILAAGRSVVLDAAFLRPAERDAAEQAARTAGVAFEGVWMDAPASVLRARVAARRNDASDADVAVLERQLALDLGEIGWRRVGVGSSKA